MQTARAILSCTGKDRPGLLDEIASFLVERGGNIQDSRLLNLHGSFAMLALISAPAISMDVIQADLPKLADSSRIRVDLNPATISRQVDSFGYRFTATGRDQSGVLQRVSHLLRVLNINIEDVKTRLLPSEDQRPPFELELLLCVPREIPVSMLRDYIKHLCTEMEITWELTEA